MQKKLKKVNLTFLQKLRPSLQFLHKVFMIIIKTSQ